MPFHSLMLLHGVIALSFAMSIGGFWALYFGADAAPTAYHHLHVLTTFTWLLLLAIQLNLYRLRFLSLHRRIGQSLFFFAPFLGATLVLLTVHSASRAAALGQPDPMLIQNGLPALETILLIVMGFAVRSRRLLHGHFMVSSVTFFLGIATFFALISLVPGYVIEGPDTYYRFEKAASTSVGACVAVCVVMFLGGGKDSWPWLVPAGFLLVNGLVQGGLSPEFFTKITGVVGATSETLAFAGSFLAIAGMLLAANQLTSRGGLRP